MPNKVKFGLSVLVLAVTAAMFFYETDRGSGHLQWVAVGLALFMIAAIWLFPEAKGGKGRHTEDSSQPR